jgi:hypothetical protein
MQKSVERSSGDIMLYLFDLEPYSDFIRLQVSGRQSLPL